MILSFFEKKTLKSYIIFLLFLFVYLSKELFLVKNFNNFSFSAISLFILSFVILYRERIIKSTYFIFFIFFWFLAFKDSFLYLNSNICLFFIYLSCYFFLKEGLFFVSFQNLFNASFFIGLAVIFYPPSIFYLLLALFGLKGKLGVFLKKLICSLLGFVSPLWIYFLSRYLFYDLEDDLLKFSFASFKCDLFLDKSFYLFLVMSIGAFFIYIKEYMNIKKQNFLFKSKANVYFLSIFSAFPIFFFSSNNQAYSFFLLPFCFYFSRFMEDLKRIWIKETLVYLFLAWSVFFYFF